VPEISAFLSATVMEAEFQGAFDGGDFFEERFWTVVLGIDNKLLNGLLVGDFVSTFLTSQIPDFNDKIELSTNKIDGIILFYFLIQFKAADSILNDKGLNFIRGVMWMVTSVFDSTDQSEKLAKNSSSISSLYSYRVLVKGWICGADWFGVEDLNLSVLFLSHFAVLNCPAGFIVLLRGDLEK
jgi:hypothetical protein